MKYFNLYKGTWDDERLGELITLTGFSKKQLNKWFWDRTKRMKDCLEEKKMSYPGLIFQITNMETDQDLTPSFKKLCVNKPIFKIEKEVYE